jgi:hypothetical protein
VVEHLLAVQAQDARAVTLALRARGEAGGSDGRVVGWLLRGTLHLVRVEDYWWLHRLCAPTRLAANRRRLAQEGVGEAAAERAVARLVRELDSGALPRKRVEELLGFRGQAVVHVLLLAALRGEVVVDPASRSYALAADVVGPPPPRFDRHAALAELARRYLRGHAPADEADLAAWSGMPLRDARASLRAAGPASPVAPLRRVPPRLLGPFDEYMLGWKDRSFAVPAELARRVHPGGGIVRAVATVDGAVVGTWTLGGGLELVRDVSARDEAALDRELRSIREAG